MLTGPLGLLLMVVWLLVTLRLFGAAWSSAAEGALAEAYFLAGGPLPLEGALRLGRGCMSPSRQRLGGAHRLVSLDPTGLIPVRLEMLLGIVGLLFLLFFGSSVGCRSVLILQLRSLLMDSL